MCATEQVTLQHGGKQVRVHFDTTDTLCLAIVQQTQCRHAKLELAM